jgi:hypothetical protein
MSCRRTVLGSINAERSEGWLLATQLKKKSAFQELRRDDRMNSHVPQCPTNVIGHIGAMSSQSMEWLRCVAARTSFELELYPYS